MKKTKWKIRWLRLGSLFILFAPILGVVGYNFNDYFASKPGYVVNQSIEIGIGAFTAAGCGVLLALGKTKIFKGSRGLAVALALSILLKAIIADLVLILSAVLLGSIGHSLFKAPIEEMTKTYEYEKQANIQAKAFDNVRVAREKEEKIRPATDNPGISKGLGRV